MPESPLAILTMILPDLIRGIIALFIIVDPLGNIPIFISLTQGMEEVERKKVFQTATLTGLILLLAFALAGQWILVFFGITLYSFMIAGGILLLIIVWLVLRFIDPIYHFLGKTGSLVIARVMALLIASIAVQYVLEGLSHFQLT